MQTQRENFARPEDIAAILAMHRIAVVGLSSDPWRTSYGISRAMQEAGYEITPVNPNETEVLGQHAYASLSDLPAPPHPDLDLRHLLFSHRRVGLIIEELSDRFPGQIADGAEEQGHGAAVRRAHGLGECMIIDRVVSQADHGSKFIEDQASRTSRQRRGIAPRAAQ